MSESIKRETLQRQFLNEKLPVCAETLLKTLRPVMRIGITPQKNIPVQSSRVGGTPFFLLDESYPLNRSGEMLEFIAQINLAELPENPFFTVKAGLIQFFMDGQGEYPASSKVIFRTPEQLALKPMTDFSFLPEYGASSVGDSYAIRFEMDNEIVSYTDFRLGQLYGNSLDNKEFFDCFGSAPYTVGGLNDGGGHKIGGYARFAQGDDRTEPTNDFILLQLDSDDGLFFGDNGVMQFWLSEEDLRAGNFEAAALLNDCC